ncbi:hypothetical protein [Nocardia sp. NPDC019395]|uniref:hypothetical protein n=1 Tax=Nocardia sp. NPDC019395 TaxID=3154686 RepID=UPI0033EB30DC
MKLRKTGRIAIAGLAAVAALTLTACGSDDSDSDTGAASTSAAAETTAADTPPVPTAADLNTQLQRALDPNVPNEEKLEMVEGAEADPELPSKLSQFYTQSGAVIEVTGVNEFGGEIQATANLTLNGQTNVAEVPFVAENGVWKVQKAWACQMLTNAQIQSPACTA